LGRNLKTQANKSGPVWRSQSVILDSKHPSASPVSRSSKILRTKSKSRSKSISKSPLSSSKSVSKGTASVLNAIRGRNRTLGARLSLLKATNGATVADMREIVHLFEKENTKLRSRLNTDGHRAELRRTQREAEENRMKYKQERDECHRLRKDKEKIVGKMEALLEEVKTVRSAIHEKEMLHRRVAELEGMIARNAEDVSKAQKEQQRLLTAETGAQNYRREAMQSKQEVRELERQIKAMEKSSKA
jgi:chromosome segregation ATPase